VDVDTIEPGLDFAEAIASAVGSCQVLLALIGDRWLGSTDRTGRRKLDDSNDLVRLEIQAALERNIRVIPVLVDGSRCQPLRSSHRVWLGWCVGRHLS
jgi:TIR domain